ncbi:type I-F CRISPR-associated protein Csy3 [Thermomonas fusca]|uniref:type I-F CRISPR-associated protein Csy3 n=1 Tax=Thermomonas fusca TaxID=215690 RepID=UPI00040FC17A|nr:type I-F CRISPR-associated protein Csy3 [Thermomonas fusca]
MANELKTASVLAFERKLDPSDALMYGGDWNNRAATDNWAPIALREKSVRGTISNRRKSGATDPAKLDADIQSPNLQTVDVATLPVDADTLKVQFTVRVLAGTGQPSACNDAAYRQKLLATVNGYVAQHGGFDELAKRYAANLANGRFLWRNRIGAEQVEVTVAQLKDGAPVASWTFDALSHDIVKLTASAGEKDKLQALADVVAAGLGGSSHVLLQVTAFVRIGFGQEVFPSQELILDRGRGDKSKTLYDVAGVAAIHSQKLGNAIRTIDTWYPEAAENGPIAVEPYGSVTTQGKAYRQPKEKVDFYNLLDGWIIKDKTPDVEQQHFVIATLIRGGVFGDADK